MTRCELCGGEAYSHIIWGPAPEQQANLCEPHVAELWAATGHTTQTGGVWIQGPPRDAAPAPRPAPAG